MPQTTAPTTILQENNTVKSSLKVIKKEIPAIPVTDQESATAPVFPTLLMPPPVYGYKKPGPCNCW